LQGGLLRAGEERLVVVLSSVDRGDGEQLALEVMARDCAGAEQVLTELRALMPEHHLYRRRVPELRPHHFHHDEGAPLTVRTLPAIARDGSCSRTLVRAGRALRLRYRNHARLSHKSTTDAVRGSSRQRRAD
jgi:hypothetical protein